jgi:glycosyltransferase involved in cell wall biosynthesis
VQNDIVFSIVIPCYNEAVYIGKCIESIRANDADHIQYEIVVVDNGSSDGSVEIAKKLGAKIIENAKGYISTLRNLGLRQARGNILVTLDADIIVPSHWLKRAKEFFDNGFIGALGFTLNVPESAGWVAKAWGNRIYQKLDKIVEVEVLSSTNIFMNRSVFEEINGFDETLKTGADKDLTLRILKAGYRAISVPETSLFHLGYEKNLWHFIKKEFWRQGSSLAFAKRWGFAFRSLRNPLLSFWHLALLIMVVISPFFLKTSFSILLTMVWILPSLLIGLKKVSYNAPFSFKVSFLIVTFIRWNVAGFALLRQIPFLFGKKMNTAERSDAQRDTRT